MRRFRLAASDAPDAATVAEGVAFGDGAVVCRWVDPGAVTVVWTSVEAVAALAVAPVVLVWVDEEES